VKFKYEKLGIFCFVCGIMGHSENKCEVRFSMEQDDGVREWSAEIRAENRRQGGRLTSRWLREEGGGQREVRGGEGSRQSQQPAGGTNAGPTNADVASNLSLVVHDRSDPNQPDFIARQEQSLPINTKAHPSVILQITISVIITQLLLHQFKTCQPYFLPMYPYHPL
jgi:hypothetical protein